MTSTTNTNRHGCTITQRHCENCGSTDGEDIITGNGYSGCCNEIVTDHDTCRNHHG